jgi:hypothetical protein
MAAFDSLVVTDALHNLLPDALDASLFLGHRRREFGHCTVSLPGYRGRCNVTALLTRAGGTTGIP